MGLVLWWSLQAFQREILWFILFCAEEVIVDFWISWFTAKWLLKSDLLHDFLADSIDKVLLPLDLDLYPIHRQLITVIQSARLVIFLTLNFNIFLGLYLIEVYLWLHTRLYLIGAALLLGFSRGLRLFLQHCGRFTSMTFSSAYDISGLLRILIQVNLGPYCAWVSQGSFSIHPICQHHSD